MTKINWMKFHCGQLASKRCINSGNIYKKLFLNICLIKDSFKLRFSAFLRFPCLELFAISLQIKAVEANIEVPIVLLQTLEFVKQLVIFLHFSGKFKIFFGYLWLKRTKTSKSSLTGWGGVYNNLSTHIETI